MNRPDCEKMLGSLKDFQRNTVEYIFRRLYTDRDCTRRFLVADEVGLGKTLVARGVMAKAIDHLWEKVPRIDVVYICSNANIARQNIRKLNITGKKDLKTRRISLLPSEIMDLKKNKVNFIPLTPGTSFDMTSGTGIGDERALLYWMLKDAWDLGQEGEDPKKVFSGGMKLMNFKRLVREYPEKHFIDRELKAEFLSLLQKYIGEETSKSGTNLRDRVKELSKAFSEPGLSAARKKEIEKESGKCISELRKLLVRSCLKALEPDLIILDEFQRFKHLMYGEDGEDEFARELATELFSYADENSEARVLLLSATPYKMYTTASEAGTEDHYKDFLRTVEFLHQDHGALSECEGILREYRQELFHISDGNVRPLVELKEALEANLRKVMVRTERLAASDDRNGMLMEISDGSAKLEASDLIAYCGLQKVADHLGSHDSLEYWKSAPYTLNFMDKYDLKNAFERACNNNGHGLYNILRDADGLMLPWEYLEAYKEIDPGNARLRSLLAGTIGADAWKLLWIPPSLPYYNLGGPYADPGVRNFTKRLVFSSWRMVPRMVASLTSYEAERRMIGLFDPSIRNTPESRKRLGRLLKFARNDKDNRLTGMQVLGTVYPSITLARACDPMRMGTQPLPSIEEVINKTRTEIEQLLRPLIVSSPTQGLEDENWYWAAPILLDKHYYGINTEKLLRKKGLADVWAGKEVSEEEEDDEGPSLWEEHVSEIVSLIDGNVQLKRPPSDLSLVLAEIAIAGPGTSCLRALARATGGLQDPIGCEPLDKIWVSAARMSRTFIRLFNLPTSIALLRGLNAGSARSDLPYWRQALRYCLDGGLQAVLDEYIHFLKESEGLFGYDRAKAADRISGVVTEALKLRTASIEVDEISLDKISSSVSRSMKRMRTNFAVMLSDEMGGEGRSENRIAQVRSAFNSPFWPFVLATTSIGQEGLDFHPYCHAVVHWNLPSNPVDLEQREGRVHRYKGHAIRKNLAARYGLTEVGPNDPDPWDALFKAGVRDRKDGFGDLVPFWIYPLEGGAKIERYVPALPLSRDKARLQDLQKSLAIYRMVFGQPRQEDLIAALMSHVKDEEIDKLTIDLSPPNTVDEVT